MHTRPLGIVLVVIYSAISAVLSLLVALLAFGGGVAVGREMAGWLGLLGVFLLGLAVVYGAVAYGLWTRQTWAPQLTINVYWVSVALGVAALLYDLTLGNIVLQLVGIVIALVVIRYVRKPEVTALFATP